MLGRIVIGSAALVTWVHTAAWACSCMPTSWSADELVAQHDVVVWGEVRSVRAPLASGCGGGSSLDPVNVRIEVLEAYAGATAGEVITVQTARSDASCGVPFEEGQTWLVAAVDGESVSLCGPSEQLAEDHPRLEELRALAR